RELCARRHDRYRLQIQGDARPFLDELRQEGVEITSENGRGEIRVIVPRDWQTRNFFVLADHHDVLIRGLIRDDESLEELFYRMVNLS
ncbi:MAG: hypothetical protein N2039_08650, partial [Gemmataceae bacterium]|nr:hypothetical protein [Gemmataceae bacterium]